MEGAREVFHVELPPDPDGGKQGVDDFLVANDEEAFWELVERAKPVDTANPNERISSVNLITSTPPELREAAYHGIVGEIIRAVSPFTEATDAGILTHLLPVIGVYIGIPRQTNHWNDAATVTIGILPEHSWWN